jgi:hypothetical protein
LRTRKRHKFTKVFIWITSIVLLNIIALMLLLQAPAIQTRLAQYLSRVLSGKTGFNITVDAVDIKWVDRFSIHGLSIIDDNNHSFLTLESVDVNYKLGSLLKEHIHLDKADLQGLNLQVHKEENDTFNISILINRIKQLNKKENKKSSTAISIDEINISKSSFNFYRDKEKIAASKFNPKNFNLENIEGHLQSLMIVSDTFKVDIVNLQTLETSTGREIHKLRTNYLISPREMRFDSLYAHFGESEINKNLVFKYSDYKDLGSFTDSVYIEADFDKARISAKDLSLFSAYFENINDHYVVSGSFQGEVADFKIKNFDFDLGRGSNLAGSVYFSGLPNIAETFIDIRLQNSTIYENDIEQYIPSQAFKSYNRFKQVQLNGSFTGYVEDFVAYGKIKTDLGTIVSDINLKIANEPGNTTYSGKIQLDDFDLGQYLNNKVLGKIKLDGKVAGRGINMSNANLSFDGAIDSLSIRGYTYSNIKTSGKFEQEYFSGFLDVNDPNLKLHTQNEIDLRDNANKIKISGELEFAQLNNLGFVANHALVKSKIEVDFKGFALDSIIGYIYLEDFYAEHKEQQLLIESLTLNSEKDNGQRAVELITDKANIKVWGDFNFTSAYRDLRYLGKEYLLSLINNKDSIASFYANQKTIDSDEQYTISAQARFINIDRFLKLFAPSLSLHSSTSIDIKFDHSNASTLAFQALNDTVSYNGNTVVNNIINVDASKFMGKPEILAAADIQSAKQILSNGAILDDLIISAVWDNNKIDFNWYHTQPTINNTNDIYGEIYFFKDSTQIHLNKSNLTLLDETWTIQDNNFITIANQNIYIQNLNLSSHEQMLTVAGVVSRDPEKILAITANNLAISNINSLISKKLSGRLSGEFAISGIYDSPTIVSNFYINAFAINQILLGDIYSSNDWNNNKNLFDIQLVVSRDDSPMILINGVFNPFDKMNALDLNASFINAQLDIAEPFIEKLFSKLQGGITGNINITGPLQSPKISGAGLINNAGLKVNYLNTFYDVEGKWAFDSTAIYLNELLLTDANNNNATLGGRFTHTNFKNFSIDLKGSMQDFLVLKTTAKDNELFYGTGITSGTLDISGPIEDITIKAQATTERNTKFYIPIGGSSSSELEDYISFVDFSDTLQNLKTSEDKDVKITGLNLEFDLDITEDAYSEIIFDITSGDIIRGRGNGHISLKIDTKGEFSMLGGYEFVSGGYNFTMYNIVNKEFIINPRSKITWSGDPYSGIMDIDASYKVSTSLAPLVDTIYHDMPDLKRIYPTEVLLSLDGPLLTPDIEFQIIIDEYPKSNVDLDTQVKGFLNTIATDQQELNRQVFSLLILRRFSPPNSFSSSGTIGSSVSEFVSNQLSYWISQVDDNLTIDMDLGDLDADALRTFQLRISYEFMEGKLIVTRDGGFTNPDNVASVESIAGDWTLEYLLSEDGKLRIKLFNRTNYNQLNSATGSASQALMSDGFSLIFTTSFDKLGELFENKRKKGKKEKNTEPTTSAVKPEEIRQHVPE